MIPIRLPWRLRARPSATLHEIPACSISELAWDQMLQAAERAVKRDFPRGISTIGLQRRDAESIEISTYFCLAAASVIGCSRLNVVATVLHLPWIFRSAVR